MSISSSEDVERKYNDKDTLEGDDGLSNDDRPLPSTAALSIASMTSMIVPFPGKSARLRHVLKRVGRVFSSSTWGVSHPAVRAVTPTFIHRRRPSSASGAAVAVAPAVVRDTSYLDGFRGVASLLVVLHHFLYTTHRDLIYPYGRDGKNYHIFQLPFFRFFVTGGHAQVSIFFVISGFVLSHKPLKRIRRKDTKSLLVVLTSSAFRRGIRLFLPAFGDAVIAVFLLQLGAFDWSDKYKNNWGWHPVHPKRAKGMFLQFKDMLWLWWHLANPWKWETFWFDYDRFLWTIPIEFRESIILFVSLLAVSKAKEGIRMVILAGIGAHAAWCYRWTVGCFLAGAVISNICLILQDQTVTVTPAPPSWKSRFLDIMRTSKWVKRYHALVFITGFYLASAPADYVLETPGFKWTARFIPSSYPTNDAHRFVQSAGAVLLIYSTSQLKFAQGMFTTRFALYLGKISYAMYLSHGNLHRCLSYWLCAMAWKVTGMQTDVRYTIGAALGGAVYFVALFWIADLVWRWLDLPSTKFARTVEKWCSRSN